MPWILMGLALAIFFVGAFRRRGAVSILTPEEQILLKKRMNERLATSMAIGLLLGVAAGSTPWLDIPAGAACGALLGVAAGYLLVRREASVPVVKNIVFDLGGVIIDTDEKLSYEKVMALGCRMPDTPEMEAESAAKIKALVNGEITLPQYVAYLQQYMPEGVSDRAVGDAVLDSLQGIPPKRLLRLRQLKQRYHIVLLSNIGPEVWQHAVGQLAAAGAAPEELFDEVYLSYEMGVAKPNPDIYRQMLSRSRIVPSQSVYFDDRPENVAAGNAAGLRSVEVRENHIEELEVYQAL